MALAATLADATQASGLSITELCEQKMREEDYAYDAAVQARLPVWEALAAQGRTSRQDLATMRTALEQFHTQLQRASEHIEQLQQRSNTLAKQLDERETEAAALAEWLATVAVPPPVVRLVSETAVSADIPAWVHAVRCVDEQQRVMAAYEAALPTPPPASARAEVAAVAEQCRTLVRALMTYTDGSKDLYALASALGADSHIGIDRAAHPSVLCGVAPQ